VPQFELANQRGAIPVDEAMQTAKQIAAAIEVACCPKMHARNHPKMLAIRIRRKPSEINSLHYKCPDIITETLNLPETMVTTLIRFYADMAVSIRNFRRMDFERL
jgi:hypothetical protein